MAVNKIIYGNTTLIDLTGDTVVAEKLAYGYIAHDRSGTVITGSNTYDADTSDATASASEILATKTAYVNGSKVTGTMTNNGAVAGTISNLNTPYTVPQGYHDGSGTVGIDATQAARIIPSNILAGVEILGVTGTLEPASGVTATSISVTPYTTAKTYNPPSGYDYITQATVAAISYVETSNTYGTTVTIGTVAST